MSLRTAGAAEAISGSRNREANERIFMVNLSRSFLRSFQFLIVRIDGGEGAELVLLGRERIGPRAVGGIDGLGGAVGEVAVEVRHVRPRLRVDEGGDVEGLVIGQ